jgi:hypothetical protein
MLSHFWSHSLVEISNATMYDEFEGLVLDDFSSTKVMLSDIWPSLILRICFVEQLSKWVERTLTLESPTVALGLQRSYPDRQFQRE